MDVLYFAWVRERIGHPKDRIESTPATVMDLVEELRAREDRYAAAFSDLTALRVAVVRSCGISTRPSPVRARWHSFRR